MVFVFLGVHGLFFLFLLLRQKNVIGRAGIGVSLEWLTYVALEIVLVTQFIFTLMH